MTLTISDPHSTASIRWLDEAHRHLGSGGDLLQRLHSLNDDSDTEADAVVKSGRRGYRHRVPAILQFAVAYLGGGFLRGRRGFHQSMLKAAYAYFVQLKLNERQSDWRGRTNELVDKLLKETGPNAPAPQSRERKSRVDVMVPTLNESDHIGDTVQNARETGTPFVLDSFSNDGTQQLARAAGGQVIERAFTNYSDHKNWGLSNVPFGAEWIFILDADERITPALRDEVARIAESGGPIDGYYVNRIVLMMGRELRHGGMYPSWNLRFFRRGRARYENRLVHEHMVCDGPTEFLKHDMLHIRREPLHTYLKKHIAYAHLESDEWVKRRLGKSDAATPEQLFIRGLRVRQWIRRKVWSKLPGTYVIRFFYQYGYKLGFLDGTPGWRVAWLMFYYEYLITLLFWDKYRRAIRSANVLADS